MSGYFRERLPDARVNRRLLEDAKTLPVRHLEDRSSSSTGRRLWAFGFAGGSRDRERGVRASQRGARPVDNLSFYRQVLPYTPLVPGTVIVGEVLVAKPVEDEKWDRRRNAPVAVGDDGFVLILRYPRLA